MEHEWRNIEVVESKSKSGDDRLDADGCGTGHDGVGMTAAFAVDFQTKVDIFSKADKMHVSSN